MKKIISNSIKIIVSLLIAAVILYFTYRDYDFSLFWSDLAGMHLGWLIAAVTFSALGPVFRGLRWNLILEPIGYRIPARDSILTVFTGYAANILIPRFGEISRCAILDTYNKVPFSKSFGTLVAERFVDMILLVLITGTTVLTQFDKFTALFRGDAALQTTGSIPAEAATPLLQTPGFWIWTAVALITVITVSILWVKFDLWEKTRQFVRNFWSGFTALKSVSNLPLFIIWSIGIWICYYLEMYLAFFCMDSTAAIGPTAGLVCFVAGSIAVLIPTPNGAGPWHWSVASMLVLYGVSHSDAQTFALVLHTAQTFAYLLFGAIAWIALHLIRRK